MSPEFDLVIIGMGPGGAAAAEYASGLGRKVAVVERDRVGGTCLWAGCLPSTSLAVSARAAHAVRRAGQLGVHTSGTRIDLPAIWKRMRGLQAEIAATDQSPLRYAEMGIEVVRGDALLAGPHTVEVSSGRRLETRNVLICTGSRPDLPDLPDLDPSRVITPEDLFQLSGPPDSICVLGADSVAVELAQSLARLGIATTLVHEGPTPLADQEPCLTGSLVRRLADDGVSVIASARLTAVGTGRASGTMTVSTPDGDRVVRADRVLAAGGRVPNVEGLGLAEAGVRLGPRGVEVDWRGRSSVPTVYAAGAAGGTDAFAQLARHSALTAVQDMFGGRPSRDSVTTRCVFTDPELASTGLTSAEAIRRLGGDAAEIHRIDLSSSLRARVEGLGDAAIVLVTAGRRLVGAHVLAPSASEMIHGFGLAISQRLALDDLARVVHAYPTLASSLARLASDATPVRDGRRHAMRWQRRSA